MRRCVCDEGEDVRRWKRADASHAHQDAPMKRLQAVLDEYVVLKEQVRRTHRRGPRKKKVKKKRRGRSRTTQLTRWHVRRT